MTDLYPESLLTKQKLKLINEKLTQSFHYFTIRRNWGSEFIYEVFFPGLGTLSYTDVRGDSQAETK